MQHQSFLMIRTKKQKKYFEPELPIPRVNINYSDVQLTIQKSSLSGPDQMNDTFTTFLRCSSFEEDDLEGEVVAASHYFLRVGQWRQTSSQRILQICTCIVQSSVWKADLPKNVWCIPHKRGVRLLKTNFQVCLLWVLEAHCTHLRVTRSADLGSAQQIVKFNQRVVSEMYRECLLKCSLIKNNLASDGTFQRSPRCENSSPCNFGEFRSTIVFCPFYPVGRRKREKLRMACLNVLKAEIKILEATFSKSHER